MRAADRACLVELASPRLLSPVRSAARGLHCPAAPWSVSLLAGLAASPACEALPACLPACLFWWSGTAGGYCQNCFQLLLLLIHSVTQSLAHSLTDALIHPIQDDDQAQSPSPPHRFRSADLAHQPSCLSARFGRRPAETSCHPRWRRGYKNSGDRPLTTSSIPSRTYQQQSVSKPTLASRGRAQYGQHTPRTHMANHR